MPCSSSETGAGSSWDSCCSALTAFLSEPPATSSRTQELLNSGSRSRTRGSRVNSRGSGIGDRILPSYSSPSSAFDNALLSPTGAVSAAAPAVSSREDCEASTHDELRFTFYNDAAFASADRLGRTSAAGVVGRSGWSPYSALALGDEAAVIESSSFRDDHSDGRGRLVRPEQQEQTASHSAGAVLATAARAAAASWSASAASPGVYNASIVSIGASAAGAAVSTGAAPAVSASTAATLAAVTGISLAAADGNCGFEQADSSFTQWRSWLGTTESGIVNALAEADTTAVLHASPHRLRHGPETEEELGAQHTSQQLRRGPQASTKPLTRIPSSQWNGESDTSCEGSFATALIAETGPVDGDEAGNVGSLLGERRIHGAAATFSVGTHGVDSPAKEESNAGGAAAADKANNRGPAAEWRLNETACSGSAPAADDGRAFLAAGAGPAAAEEIVFYSPGRSRGREAEARGTVFVLPREVQQQEEMCLAQQEDLRVQFAHSRPALHPESEGNASLPVRADMAQGHAEREGAAEAPYGPILCAVASAGVAGYAVRGRVVTKQESSSAGQPSCVPLPQTGPVGSSLRAAAVCQKVRGSQRAEDGVKDDTALLQVVPASVVVHADTSLLRGPDGELACVPVSQRASPAETRGTAQLRGAARTLLDAGAPLGGEAVSGAVPSEAEVMVKRMLATSATVCGSAAGAVEPTRNGRMSSMGEFLLSAGGKRGGQPSRQRPFLGGSEECNEWGDSLLAGERTFASRRGRCQRPASWKRVRQTMGEGQLPYRGGDLFLTAGPPAAVLGADMRRKHLEQQQKWSGEQRRRQERNIQTATDLAEERKRPTRAYEEEGGEEILCRSSVESRTRVVEHGKANARAKKKLVCQPRADAPFAASCDSQSMTSVVARKSVVFFQDDTGVLDSYVSQRLLRTGPRQRCAHKPLHCAERERDVLQGASLSSASAEDARQSLQQQKNTSRPVVPSRAPPLSGAGCGDLCVNCRGARGSYDSGRDGVGSGGGSTAAASPRTSVLASDKKQEDAGLFAKRPVPLDVSSEASPSLQQVRRSGVDTCEKTRHETGGSFQLKTELPSGTGEDDSRRRSIGPGKFDRFDEDTSGDESNVSAGETRSRPSRQLLSLQMLPQVDIRALKSGRAVSVAPECPPSTNLSACNQTGWPRPGADPSEDVDEDEASRFFKRRRCSLLLWGGIRGERGHTAIHQASLDAANHSAHALTDAQDGAEDRDRNTAGVNTANAHPVGQVRQVQATRGASVTAPHQRLDVTRLKQQPSTVERAAEGSSDEERVFTKQLSSAPVVALTRRMTPDAAESPGGASATFPSRLMRKRKRGVGASASRLLFLQRPDAGVSTDDATLVNSLSSALTYEETQQLRRHEQEQRQQEFLRQQEEARRREEVAAARLSEQQKAAAAAMAAASVTALPSAPYVFGSATIASPSSSCHATTTATLPVQESGHTARTVERSTAPSTLSDSTTALPSGGRTADSTSVHISIPYSGTRDVYLTGQNIEQHQQAKEASLNGRPRLRIIRSPPSAGDSAVPPTCVAADAGGSSVEPCGADVAVGSSALLTPTERNADVAGPSHQQVELPAAFDGAGGVLRSPQAGGLASATEQSQMSAGLLPAEFGGVSVAPAPIAAGVTGLAAFGNANAFGTAGAGAVSSGDVR